jgi:hypothetical protein
MHPGNSRALKAPGRHADSHNPQMNYHFTVLGSTNRMQTRVPVPSAIQPSASQLELPNIKIQPAATGLGANANKGFPPRSMKMQENELNRGFSAFCSFASQGRGFAIWYNWSANT